MPDECNPALLPGDRSELYDEDDGVSAAAATGVLSSGRRVPAVPKGGGAVAPDAIGDAGDAPASLVAAADGHLRDGRTLDAGRCLQALFERGQGAEAPPELVLTTVVRLVQEGAPADAAALFAAAGSASTIDALADSQRGPSRVEVRELMALDADFPLQLRQAVAGAIILGNLNFAVATMRQFAAEHPRSAERAGELIADLPILRRAYHSILYPVFPGIEPWQYPRMLPHTRIWMFLLRLARLAVFGRPHPPHSTRQAGRSVPTDANRLDG